jgi:hypothetical protein
MEPAPLTRFIEFCCSIQPGDTSDITRFFEGVVCFPYDQELLLQAFLFFEIAAIFPDAQQLLMFEKPVNGKNTDQGKCDFVYLTAQQKILLIETKFIDTTPGETRVESKTKRTRRTAHRQKVIKQVLDLRHKFSEASEIPFEQFECGVFTTDLSLVSRALVSEVLSQAISIKDLYQWQQQKKNRLRLAYD